MLIKEMENNHLSNGAAKRKLRAKRQRRFRYFKQTGAKHTQVIAIGLGGNATSLNELPYVAPNMRNNVLAADADIKVYEDCYELQDKIHLSHGGSIETILEHKHQYSLLKDGLPDTMTPFETRQGVGKIRCAAVLLLGYNLDAVKARIRKLLERIMAKFHGPMQKRLVVNLVFGLGGGTGSALAKPFAALILDIARSISPTLQIVVNAHCVSPSMFLGVMTTPADRLRTLANGAITLRELYIAQQPRKLVRLARALEIGELKRPLFDNISYYDLSDSGGRVQPIEDVWDRICVNIAAGENQPLSSLEAARDINPAMAQSGEGHSDLGTAVIDVQHSEIVKVPVEKLCQLYAAKVVREMAASINAPGRSERVATVNGRHFAALQLDGAYREATEAVRPDGRFLLPYTVAKMSNQKVIEAKDHCWNRWSRLGRAEVQQQAEALRQDLKRDASSRLGAYLRGIMGASRSVPELVMVLRECLDLVEERKSEVQRELEDIAATNHKRELAKIIDQLERGRWGMGNKNARKEVRRRLAHMMEDECVEEALNVLLQAYLIPLANSLKAELERVQLLGSDLGTVLRQIDAQIPRLKDEIGYQNAFFIEIVHDDNLDQVVEQMVDSIPAKVGRHDPIDLSTLLTSDDESSVVNVLESTSQQIRKQADRFFHDHAKDINTFVEMFGVDFDLNAWLAEAVRLTLPAKLDLAVDGPGNAPLQAYIVAPETMKKTLMEVVNADVNPLGVEFCRGDSPFEVIVRGKISRVPFASIPGLPELDRAYHEFCTKAPTDHVWGTLVSHQSLRDARDVTFRDHAELQGIEK